MFAYVISKIWCCIFKYGGDLLYAYLVILAFSALLQSAVLLGKKLQPHAALFKKKKKVLDCVIYCSHFTVSPHSQLRLPALYFISSYRGSARHVLTLFPICCKYPYTEMLKADSQKSHYPDSCAKFKSIFILLKVGDAARTS